MALLGELQAFESAVADRYRFIREIGRGGSGIVFLADDLTNYQQVAVKVLRVELAGSIARRRFLREITLTKQLNHPHIVTVCDAGEHDGILYYLMPYVPGESLQQRLSRERQLPVDEALRVSRAVLAALGHAHSAGIVHRDIKPANILLDGERVLVADFGIARAIERTMSGDSISSPGVGVGTPPYMSPEQGSGEALDGRTDIYSLGCVLYEMLAGSVPFTGPSGAAVMARHALDPVPPLRTVRPSIPDSLEMVVLRALEKTPADRFASADQMTAAIETAISTGPVRNRPSTRKRRVPLIAALGGALALAGLIAIRTVIWSASTATVPADTSLYLVLPVEQNATAGVDVAQRLRESLRRWTDIRVVDQFTMQTRLGAESTEVRSDDDARTVARALGSGRYVRSRVEPGREHHRVTATLFDIERGQLAEVHDRIPADLPGVDSIFDRIAGALLFRDLVADARVEPRIGTRSLRARQAFLTAHRHIREWNLASADSALFVADTLDAEYAQAKLWLALVRMWRDQAAARWGGSASQAVARAPQVSSREVQMSRALVAQDSGYYDAACRAWEQLAENEPTDASLWYSAGQCRRRDDAVLPDRTSSSGWRFRSSYRLALAHYARALRLMPAIYRGLRDDGYYRLRYLLKTNETDLRFGRAQPPDTTSYVAYPSLLHDTLAFIPVKGADLTRLAPTAVLQSQQISQAVRRQRELFREWTITWSSNYPQSAEAWEAVAISLDALGDASALDTIARAASMAKGAVERRRVRGTQTWMLVKFSIPSNITGLRQARALADSLLRDAAPQSSETKLLMSLAALTGRLALAEQLGGSLPTYPRSDMPAELNSASCPLLLNAVMGGPNETIVRLEHLTDSLIDVLVVDTGRVSARSLIIGRAAALAYPIHKMSALSSDSPSRNYLFDAFKAWHRGDSGVVSTMTARLRTARAALRPANLTFDALYPEAWLIAASGKLTDAARWLDPTLTSLPQGPPMAFVDPIHASALIRSMALRAELAHRLGDRPTARLWARAVTELWRHADASLRGLTDEMRRLTH